MFRTCAHSRRTGALQRVQVSAASIEGAWALVPNKSKAAFLETFNDVGENVADHWA